MWPRVVIVGSLALTPRSIFHHDVTTSLTSAATDATKTTKSSSHVAHHRPGLSWSSSSSSSSSSTALFSSSSSDDNNNDNNHETDDDNAKMHRVPPGGRVIATSPYSTLLSGGALSLEKYHLIWSPHAWKKLVGTSMVLLILPRFRNVLRHNRYSSILWAPLSTMIATGWYQNLILPLIASSCCIIQLGLNILSVGCAGWNSYLGPVRPYFLGILLVSSFRHRSSYTTLVWRSTIALLPEIVHLYNVWQNHRYQKQQQKRLTLQHSSLSSGMDQRQHYVVELAVPTMGCVACISNVDASLRKVPGVQNASSALQPAAVKGGTATVVLAVDQSNNSNNNGEDDGDDTVTVMTQRIIRAVADAGFHGAYVTSIRPQTQKSESYFPKSQQVQED